MMRATAGAWINYGTTLLFQVIFAARFGSTGAASVFVVVFGVAIAVGGVSTASVRSVVVPRLLDADGAIVKPALRLALAFAGTAALALIAIAALAPAVVHAIAGHTAVPVTGTASVLRAAAGFVLLEVLAGTLIAFALALGHRFLPAAAPAVPSLTGALLLLIYAKPSLVIVYAALSAGSCLELALLSLVVGRRAVADERLPPIGMISTATAVQFAALAFVPAFERVMASSQEAGGAAAFNYALRSLAVVQQLLLGGWILASLGDWARLARDRDRLAFRASFRRTFSGATIVLVLAASLGLIFARPFVAAVFQRGSFTAADSKLVGVLLVLALPGFCAEGLTLVLSQALLAHRRNTVAIFIGFSSVCLRVSCAYIAGVHWGARGVAVGYSIAASTILIAELVASAALGLVAMPDFSAMTRGAFVATGTALSAVILQRLGTTSAVAGALVFACFLGLVVAIRPEFPRVGRA